MISEWLHRLRSQSEPEHLPEPDAKLALGALMVRVAKADKTYRVEEIALIDRLLADRFQLNPVEAAKMRATCEKLEHDAPDSHEFEELVKQGVHYPDRLSIYHALWRIMLADGHQHTKEHAVLKETADALGILDTDRGPPSSPLA